MGCSGLTVAEVVVRLPKTLGTATTVGEACAALQRTHVHMLLLTDAGRLVGTLLRSDLPSGASGAEPALKYAVLRGRTVSPDLDAEEARRLLVNRGERRRAVVRDDGELLGLLCLKRRLNGFCSDADVTARAADGVLVIES